MQPTYWSEKQCNSREPIWTRKIHLQEERKVKHLEYWNTCLSTVQKSWGIFLIYCQEIERSYSLEHMQTYVYKAKTEFVQL